MSGVVSRSDPHAPAHGAQDDAVARAFATCRDITRSEARNFYYGLMLTPEPRRSALYAVYAWMRRADDEADAPGPIEAKHAALGARRRTLERVARGEAPPDDPIWVALADAMRRYPLDPRVFHEMIDGLEEDTRHAGYDTRDALAHYCYRVASTVGLACVSIWGLRRGATWDDARPYAERRGLAFQLTNILRDFREDLERGRIYIAREDFARRGLTPQALRDWSPPDACRELALDVCAWARAEYDASAPLDGLIDPACAPTLRAMTRIYSGVLRRIERAPRLVAGPGRARLSTAHKVWIASAAFTSAGLLGRRKAAHT